jgi:dihydropteroate synthase
MLTEKEICEILNIGLMFFYDAVEINDSFFELRDRQFTINFKNRKTIKIRGKTSLPSKNTNRKQKKCQRVILTLYRLGYNPVTHAYEESNRGQALRSHD